MVEVDLDQSDDWNSTQDWQTLAERAVAAALVVAGFAPVSQVSLSVSLSDNDEVQALNAQWRGKDKPTNVLSFPMLEAEELVALDNPPRNGEGDQPQAGGGAGAGNSHPQGQETRPVPLRHSSSGPPPPLGEDRETLLGDIILAHGICADEATEKAISLADHATHLIIHGTLHLLGLDHIDDEAAEHMEALEVKALASLGLGNPYSDH